MLRIAAVTVAALACSACANESAVPPMGLGFHGQLQAATPAPVAPLAANSKTTRALPAHEVKQTLGGKVLSAIALERVTGRKPDPRRFKELR